MLYVPCISRHFYYIQPWKHLYFLTIKNSTFFQYPQQKNAAHSVMCSIFCHPRLIGSIFIFHCRAHNISPEVRYTARADRRISPHLQNRSPSHRRSHNTAKAPQNTSLYHHKSKGGTAYKFPPAISLKRPVAMPLSSTFARLPFTCSASSADRSISTSSGKRTLMLLICSISICSVLKQLK